MSCEFDCLRTYSCSAPIEAGTVAIGGERYPGAVFAPWVQVGIEGEGTNITVGNRSSPPDNHAIIKSFEYGFSEGAGVKIEIFDEEGSSLSTFVNRLSKTLCEATQDYKMSLDFGWIIQYCDGSIEMNRASDHGNRLWFLPLKIEMALENGKIKYTIEGTDLQDRVSENRLENNQGREDNMVDLKDAIRTMFRESCPHIEDVRFEDKDGNEWNFKNSDGGQNGPRSVWTTDQQNALATTRKWIAPLMTENDKGVVFQWKPDEQQPCVVLLEDPNSAPDENDPCCDVHLATYIVNGGNCSPVLQFSPQVNWTLAANAGAGGQQAGGVSAGHEKQEGRDGSNVERVGTQTQFPVNQNDVLWRGPEDIVGKAQDANAAHEAAVRFREVPSSITAELKIIGDPSLAFPLGGAGLIGRTVSIVVINPFYITGGSACEWLASPPCNQILSNKRWMIQGANHQIREGSYTTTLKLFLEVPNVELNPGEPLGGRGCGTLTFDNDQAQNPGD